MHPDSPLKPNHAAKLHDDRIAELIDDDALLIASGLPSVPTLKKVLGLKLLQPQYQPIEGGGRKRAWSSEDVQIARAIVALAAASGLSLMSATAVLQRAGRSWLSRLIGRRERSGGGGWVRSPAQEVPSRLILCDLEKLWIEVEGGGFCLIDPSFNDAPLIDPPSRANSQRLDASGVLGSCAVAMVFAIDVLLAGTPE
jgi:hypothetical protein